MATDRCDAVVVRYRPVRGPPRRVVFEPLSDGRIERTEAEWTGCTWRPVGREVVTRVIVETPADEWMLGGQY